MNRQILVTLTVSVAAFLVQSSHAKSPLAAFQKQARQVQRTVRSSVPKVSKAKSTVSRARKSSRSPFDKIQGRVKNEIARQIHRKIVPNPVARPKPRPGGKPINKILPHPGNTILPHPGHTILPHPHPGPLPHPIPRPCPQPLPIPRPCPQPLPIPIVCPKPIPICFPRPFPQSQPIVDPIPEPIEEITDPVPQERPEVAEGQQVNLPITGLPRNAGSVKLYLGAVSVSAKLLAWETNQLTFEAPSLGITEPVPATLVVAERNGGTIVELPILFIPRPSNPLPQVPVGSRLTLSGDDLGVDAGQVRVKIGVLQVRAKILDWSPNAADVLVPSLDLSEPTAAELIIFDSQGNVAEQTMIQLVDAR